MKECYCKESLSYTAFVSDSETITVSPHAHGPLWILVWALLFFVLINVVVYVIFDTDIFGETTYSQLLMQGSDNEMRAVIDKLHNDDRRHVVLIGKSVTWGVHDVLQETFSSRPEYRDRTLVTIASPGFFLPNLYAALDAAYNHKDTFVVFLSPFDFEPYYADRPFQVLMKYPLLAQRELADDREALRDCCDFHVPQDSDLLSSTVSDAAFSLVPLYRNRDLINKSLIGLQPYVVVHAVIGRTMNELIALTGDRPFSDPPGPLTKHRNQDLTDGRMARMVEILNAPYRSRDNVFYVLLDTNRYEPGALEDGNYREIERIVGSDRTLSLHKQIRSHPEHYRDTMHLTREGGAVLAERVFQFLFDRNAL